MSAYKQDRYGGWLGGLRWAKDKLLGMPDKVNEFYAAGRELYLKEMDGVISRVADIVGGDLTAAKQRIAKGRADITAYVKTLSPDLQKVGAEASKEIGDKFDQLESDVNDKQNAVVETLASKYVEARKGLDERIEALQAENKGLVDKAIGAIKAVINTIRNLVEMLKNTLARAAAAIGDIIKDPIGFLGNLIGAVKGGINKFFSNIGAHLKKGLMGWLFGQLGDAGIEIPDTFDIKGIIKLLASIFGLTWANIRNRIVKQIGEKAMAAVEKGVDIFQKIASGGLGAVWEMLMEKLGDIKNMIMEQIEDFVLTKIITAGITWLISLLNPAAAFIKACKLIYDVVMFFVNNAERIMKFVNTVIDGVVDIAKGNVSAVVDRIEDALSQMVPILIGFIASVLGIGGIGEKIKSIIQALQKPVNKALDFVIKTGLKLAGPVIRAVSGLGAKAKAKFNAGKAWVKGKADAAKGWAKGKVDSAKAAIAGLFKRSFSVRLPGGGAEQHTVTSNVGSDGRVQTVVASTPTQLPELLTMYRARLPELPARVRDRQPRSEAATALNNIGDAQTSMEQASGNRNAFDKAQTKLTNNLSRLLAIHAEFGRPTMTSMPEAANVKQTMTARITVKVPPKGRALEMAGSTPRGTGDRAPSGSGYELFNVDPRLPAESSNKRRGGVYTGTNAPNTSEKETVLREVVTRGWAAGGKAYFNSNTGHTESQFDRFLDEQGEAFRKRIVSIEIHSTLSPCSACTSMLRGIRATLDKERAPEDPEKPEDEKIPPAVLTFFWKELYAPQAAYNIPDRQAAQTTSSDIGILERARWILSGPRP